MSLPPYTPRPLEEGRSTDRGGKGDKEKKRKKKKEEKELDDGVGGAPGLLGLNHGGQVIGPLDTHPGRQLLSTAGAVVTQGSW